VIISPDRWYESGARASLYQFIRLDSFADHSRWMAEVIIPD